MFLHVFGHSIGAFVNQPRDNGMKIHHMTLNHTISNGSRKTESIRKRFLMPGVIFNRYIFFTWIVAQDSREFFNCWIEFSNVEPDDLQDPEISQQLEGSPT